jgi:toxin-antitoxin system PIN domain toxin
LIVPDLNLLLYAHFDGFPQHERARAWWEGCMNGREPVGLAPPVVFGFVRLATSRKVFRPPMEVSAALGVVEGWVARSHVQLLVAGPRHVELAFSLLRALGTAANLTTDAQIAAFALEHQALLCSNDSDFSRFSGLKYQNPIAT